MTNPYVIKEITCDGRCLVCPFHIERSKPEIICNIPDNVKITKVEPSPDPEPEPE